MPTTIAIITTDAATSDLVGNDITVLDGMIEAQNLVGQITWTELSTVTAKGEFRVQGGADEGAPSVSRIVIVDTDNADATEAITAALWVTAAR